MRNPLNDSDVNGNTQAWMADQSRESSASHEDHYKCDCGEIVPDHEFIHELKMCQECFADAYGHAFVSIDQAEYLEGDR